MYRGNKEYYALKRKLIDEAKAKINNLPIEKSVNFKTSQSTPAGLTFVYEWCDTSFEIIGYGCNSNGDACYIKPQIEPGLFVVSCDIVILKHVCALYGYDIKVYDIEFDTNNFNVSDLLQDYSICQPAKLIKIMTKTVFSAEKLYNKFKYTPLSYKYVGIPQYFSVTVQVMFEMLLKNNSSRYKQHQPLNYTVPKTTMGWFDEHLNVYQKYAAPEVPLIIYDIETVSSDPHRVPMGDAIDDILFTVSVLHTHTNVLYTLIFIPLNMSSCDMEALIRNDGYDVVPNKSVDSSKCHNVLECFSTEKDLLTRTMQLLTLKPKLHFMYGYNSLGYDIKYLLTRCAFFKIELDNFIWREGYSFGAEQTHLDLFRIIVMRYRFKSYKLDDVSREILKDSKTGVSAVNLRYTFFRMVKYGRYFSDESSEKIPSVKDTLEYNNADTLLVFKLESRTKCIPFVIQKAMNCQVPLTSMNTNYNKMQFKLWSECFVVGLELKMFLATFKEPIAYIKCPMPSVYSQHDIVDVALNLTEQLNSNSTDLKRSPAQTYAHLSVDKKSRYPGGVNHCLGEEPAKMVHVYDYVTAYPMLMDKKNISDETTTILPASILALLYTHIDHTETFKTYDYLTHNGSTKSETVILQYQYIYDGVYCGGEFPFTLLELNKRHDSPVIVIWEGRRGILSQIVAKFSATRAITKLNRKLLDEIYDRLIEKKTELSVQQILMSELLAESLTMNHDGEHKSQIGLDDDDDTCSIEMFGVEVDSDVDNSKSSDSEIFGCESDVENAESVDDDFGYDNNDDDMAIDANSAVLKNIDMDTNDNDAALSQHNHIFENLPEIVNRILKINGNMCIISDFELNKEVDPLATISDIADLVALERNNVSNSYDLQKAIVASIYGCIGKMSIVSAAVITSLTRSTLLASAQYCRKLGYNVLYIDTDSVMLDKYTTDLSPQLNQLFPFMEMQMKLFRECWFVQTKIYYPIEADRVKYGQNSNGPSAWHECAYFFFNRRNITTNPDIYNAFYDFFIMTYAKLKTFKTVTPEFLKCFTQTIRTKDEYKTMTVAKKFKMYLAEKYPALAGSNRHTVFYCLDNSVLLPCLKPELDIKTVDDLRFVNLFKYFQNMYSTIFNFIKFCIKKNNHPYNITLSSKYVLLLMLKGFLDAYEVTFSKIESDLNLELDAEQVFTEPIHTEVLSDNTS